MTTSEAVRAALSWLATYGVHSTLFLGGAWALCALRPPKVNRNRERLWKLALVGGLVSATLQSASGSRPLLGRIDWQPTAAARPESSATESARKTESPAAGAPEIRTAASQPARGTLAPERLEQTRLAPPLESPEALATALARDERAVQAEPARTLATQNSAVPDSSPHRTTVRAPALFARLGSHLSSPSWSQRWPGLVLGLWSVCGLLGLAGLAFSWSILRRRMLGRRILTTGPLVELLERVRARAGLRQHVRLSVSPRIAAPFSTGLFHPEVCVPTRVLTALNPAQQEALLAHELAHLARRDPTWFGFSFLIEKLFFFQPLNRLARRRLSELAELACDDWAVRWTGARIALASCLAEVAGWVVGERPLPSMPPSLAGNRSRLGHRVERLLDDRRSPSGEPPTRWWPPLAAAVLTTATLAVPGVSAEIEARETFRPKAKPAREDLPAIAPVPFLGPATSTVLLEEPPSADLSCERDVLESELALLESELAALHGELEARELRERFAGALQEIDTRMELLRLQQRRARELLAQLASPTLPNTPASGSEPDAEPFPPTDDSGDSR